MNTKDSAPTSRNPRLKPLTENILLVGFMGTGKTSVAEYLSRSLSLDAVDTDQMIVSRTGESIPGLFRSHGEAYFRDLETETLRSLIGRKHLIVSCGGGITLRAENVDLMRKIGVTVWLTATPQTIYERVRTSADRPLLNGRMNVPYIAELLAERLSRYERASQVEVPTDGLAVPEVCALLTERVSSYTG